MATVAAHRLPEVLKRSQRDGLTILMGHPVQTEVFYVDVHLAISRQRTTNCFLCSTFAVKVSARCPLLTYSAPPWESENPPKRRDGRVARGFITRG